MKTWNVKCEDGSSYNENNLKWSDITDKVVELEYNNDGQIIKLPSNCLGYACTKTASCDLDGNNVNVEAYNANVKFTANGTTLLKVSINNETNNITITLEDA